MPVHTAYAVPSAISFCARKRRAPLIAIESTASVTPTRGFPGSWAHFNPTGQPISNNPAVKRYTQLIANPYSEADQPCALVPQTASQTAVERRRVRRGEGLADQIAAVEGFGVRHSSEKYR